MLLISVSNTLIVTKLLIFSVIEKKVDLQHTKLLNFLPYRFGRVCMHCIQVTPMPYEISTLNWELSYLISPFNTLYLFTASLLDLKNDFFAH